MPIHQKRRIPFTNISLEAAAAALFFAALFAGSSSPAEAQRRETYTFTLALLGGLGGALDADIDPGLGQQSFMLEASMITEPRTLVGIRAGRLEIDGDEGLDELTRADLEYVNISGEYRFSQSFYDYGVYLGVGYYTLDGDLRTGGSDSESDVGIVLGFTGDFDVTKHISIVGDLSAHYAFLDVASIYAMANVGVAVHF
jgi:hypothetical protein